MEQTPAMVMTVLGPVPAEELGVTLTHEHLLIDMTCYWEPPIEATSRAFADEPVSIRNLGAVRRNPLLNRDNCLLTDLTAAIEEIAEFRMLGGGTIVDVTLPDIGRDPVALQMAARASGLNIVAGCGHYVHHAHPASLEAEPLEAIEERLLRELTDGIGTSGVRPGVIGEIGTSDPIHPREEKVLRAAARAQKATGVPISIHLHPPSRTGNEVLRILDDEGVDPQRVVLGHVDISLGHLDLPAGEPKRYFQSLAERGCFLEFDTCGNDAYFDGARYGRSFWCPSDRERAAAVAALFEADHGHQILLSHDICHKFHLLRYGGFGYGHILRTFVRNLADAGLNQADIAALLVDNPLRMLCPSKGAVARDDANLLASVRASTLT